MGVVENITASEFPKQGPYLHRVCRVLFNYGEGGEIGGIIVRADYESPGRTIIRLDDGRYVLGTECQYSPFPKPEAAS